MMSDNNDYDFFGGGDDPLFSDQDQELQGIRDERHSIIESIVNELDRLSVYDWVVDFSDVNLEELRGDRFTTLGDAIIYLYEVGILDFADIFIDQDGLYSYVVNYAETT